ncbi:MAG: DUF3090 family protein [Acidimicrobiia bacterium]|nr:DUF3090 family protein [Acidimicrobiia bacterium]
MSGVIEFDAVDTLTAGAIGEPGERTFLIQARKNDAELTVVVEKEQVALLATEVVSFLDRVSGEYPEARDADTSGFAHTSLTDAEPLFRASLIGLGFDPARDMVLIELRENSPDEESIDHPSGEGAVESAALFAGSESTGDEGFVAKIFASRPQVRAMASLGAVAVAAGRPLCDLCDQPLDPDGHVCPRMN